MSTATEAAPTSAIVEFLQRVGARCEVEFPDGHTLRTAPGPTEFRVVFHSEQAVQTGLSQWAIGKAYIAGELDIDGDMWAVLALRDELAVGMPIADMVKFAATLFLTSPQKANQSAIQDHYTLGDDFYLTFVDQRYRFYSHCLFHDDTETLEEAAEHKLESMWQALGLQPGMRLLDIGGGWGGVAEYCSPRGVHVTSITLVEESAAYIRDLAQRKDLSVDVVLGDFLDFTTDEPFDHVVIYGVIEHIPNYIKFCQQLWRVLKPGGRLYMDASATKEKFAMSPVTRAFTWTGHHTFLCLQQMLQELLFHGFDVVDVRRETHDYELTITHWAQRLEQHRERIIQRWGEKTYRAFRVFLWGGAHAFHTNRLQAYHLVAQRRPDEGPRPGLARRVGGFLASLR
ncbi:class I SAM-dependent methyltransferase [Qaidamihabitans albus]|uniref:class I SAM-dependent methyltransferase n=1 Tax=Qaidamihabitans albus TaxID=2795733 RepID=UPI0018F1F95F|nr:class I SAM-dependent methyltransferase [Qaidamihabitans albus]